jgi:hypothetical protein
MVPMVSMHLSCNSYSLFTSSLRFLTLSHTFSFIVTTAPYISNTSLHKPCTTSLYLRFPSLEVIHDSSSTISSYMNITGLRFFSDSLSAFLWASSSITLTMISGLSISKESLRTSQYLNFFSSLS